MPTIERGGVKLYFADIGSGPAVLFHTGGGGDGRMWELAGYTSRFGTSRRLLLDHRGHGRSDRPHGISAHQVREYVADVVAVLDAAEVDRAVLVGYSAGADVVLRVAARHPACCAAVVAIGGVPQPIDVSEWDRALAAYLRKVGMRAVMEEMSRAEPEPPPTWLVENLAATDTEMFALMLEAWADAPSVWDCLPDVTAPTLLVVGGLERGEDGVVDRAVRRLPHGRAVISNSYAHLQNFWHEEVNGPVIAEFVESLHGRRRQHRARSRRSVR